MKEKNNSISEDFKLRESYRAGEIMGQNFILTRIVEELLKINIALRIECNGVFE